jgi:hypothetical protein
MNQLREQLYQLGVLWASPVRNPFHPGHGKPYDFPQSGKRWTNNGSGVAARCPVSSEVQHCIALQRENPYRALETRTPAGVNPCWVGRRPNAFESWG